MSGLFAVFRDGCLWADVASRCSVGEFVGTFGLLEEEHLRFVGVVFQQVGCLVQADAAGCAEFVIYVPGAWNVFGYF